MGESLIEVDIEFEDAIAIDEASRKRKLATTGWSNQEEDGDSINHREAKLLRLFDDGEEATPKRGKFGADQIDAMPIATNSSQPDQEVELVAPSAPIRAPDFDPVLMFTKELSHRDVGAGFNRLLMIRRCDVCGALTKKERERAETDWLRGVTRDGNGVGYTLGLKMWKGEFVLSRDWGKLVRSVGLERGDSVQGWGYRRAGHFRLRLNIFRNKFYS